MADASHLEKMGRELKCPICLSLLNSSVSLTCNHVFCNSCIMKSMKSGSNCPVCKVPFQRREVRPAPHMDNLVNIYKGMEVASGVNIFISQNVLSAKLSDTGKEPEGDPNYEDNQGICLDQVENKKASTGRKRRKAKIYTPKKCGTISAKPSFPTKKRIQVSQYPLQETPTRPGNVQCCLGETSVDRCKINSTKIKEKLVPNENGESVFTPFFWLRDEEGEEKVSQQSDSNQLMDMPTPDVPSFSDIKDSDDESPKLTPEETHGESNAADFFDSEMFDWTQRSCSPELYSSHMTVQDSEAELQSLKGTKDSSTGGEQLVNTNQGGIKAVLQPPVSSPRVKDAADQIERNKSNKRGRKTIQRTQKKCVKQTEAEAFEIHVDPKEGSVNLVEDQAGNKDDRSVNIEEINTGMGVSFDISVCEPTPQNASVVPAGIENLNQSNKNSVIKLPISSVKKSRGGGRLKVKKIGKNCKKSNHRMNKYFPAGSKKQKLHPGSFTFEEPSSENQINEDDMPQLSLSVLDDINALGIGERISMHDAEIKSAISLKGNQRSRCKKVSFTGISRVGLTDNSETQGNVSEMVTEPAENFQHCFAVRVPNASSTIGKPPSSNNEVLQKCKNISSKIQCAFCQSSEVSEASGEMVHFCDGKPVAEDYSGGSKVIHSHKNCAEWAPNVYFKGDTTINLEAELARSRRITCSCCGIKGAALGCYEKSCRKSFHVSCAKLIPQCRWDTDKFVMLCPRHPTSKFTETSGSHERRKGSKAKEQQCTLDDQVAKKHDNNTNQNWKPCGSPKKLILCCSALTVADRETISAFKEFSGVTEHKKWNSTVTHVIASTDENGACRRTLKILMGILEGKWIVSIEWVKACMQAMKPVSEEPYEITVDIHGIRDGPQLGRLQLQNKQPKLFDGLMFYLIGDFIPSYKGYLQELIIAAGGSILHRKPIPRDQETILSSSSSSTFIIYSKELPDNTVPSKKNLLLKHRLSDAKALASSTGSTVASNMWVLDCIAACKLQNLSE